MFIDFIIVYHRDAVFREAERLLDEIVAHEDARHFHVISVDNRVENVGFAKAANAGAKKATAPIVGFLNPDLRVHGPFIHQVFRSVKSSGPYVVGPDFNKSKEILRAWGLRDWVCGAAFFVLRDWFQALNGFDEDYVWGLEETDFCKRTQSICDLTLKKGIEAIDLPLLHVNIDDTEADTKYKQEHYENGKLVYQRKWGLVP